MEVTVEWSKKVNTLEALGEIASTGVFRDRHEFREYPEPEDGKPIKFLASCHTGGTKYTVSFFEKNWHEAKIRCDRLGVSLDGQGSPGITWDSTQTDLLSGIRGVLGDIFDSAQG